MLDHLNDKVLPNLCELELLVLSERNWNLK